VRLRVVTALWVLLISSTLTISEARDGIGKVVRVIDGGTLVVRLDGVDEKIRLLGVNSGEPGSRFTWYLVNGKKVILREEASAQDRDEKGRLPRYVYLQDGTFVNAEIIKRGYGTADLKHDFSHSNEFQGYERHAREEGLGLFWANMKAQLVSPGQDASREGISYAGLDGVSEPGLVAASRVQPNYPEMARKTRVQGPAVLQVIVQKDGTVGDIWVLTSPARELGFDEAAIAAVRQWRFEPARKDGTPVDARWTVTVNFVLQ
jgi:TonB family protein